MLRVPAFLLLSMVSFSACASGSAPATAAGPATPAAGINADADFVTRTQDGRPRQATDVPAFRYQSMPAGQALSARPRPLTRPNATPSFGPAPTPWFGAARPERAGRTREASRPAV